jgi:hypothetical protein
MNAEERRIAHVAIGYLRDHGLSIDQGWHLNGEPPQDVEEYLDGMIESCFPTDEDELTERVIDMIETDLS